MHLLIQYGDHIRQVGNIPMYSTEQEEVAHKEQIKNPWRRSNKTMWHYRSCSAMGFGMGFE